MNTTGDVSAYTRNPQGATMLYDVSYRIRHATPLGRPYTWLYERMTPRELADWTADPFNSRSCEWVAILRGEPDRIAPSCPKRYGGQIEGHAIKEGYRDRIGGNCRQLDHIDPSDPPIRRTDVVARQCGLSPAQLMAAAK